MSVQALAALLGAAPAELGYVAPVLPHPFMVADPAGQEPKLVTNFEALTPSSSRRCVFSATHGHTEAVLKVGLEDSIMHEVRGICRIVHQAARPPHTHHRTRILL